MTKAGEQPTITQADRDAAAEVTVPNIRAINVRLGHLDDTPLVRAFARHRTASLAAQDGLVEALGDALFNLSAKLNEAGFLKDDANHTAYEKVVSAFNGVSAIKGDKS